MDKKCLICFVSKWGFFSLKFDNIPWPEFAEKINDCRYVITGSTIISRFAWRTLDYFFCYFGFLAFSQITVGFQIHLSIFETRITTLHLWFDWFLWNILPRLCTSVLLENKPKFMHIFNFISLLFVFFYLPVCKSSAALANTRKMWHEANKHIQILARCIH